jgi:Tripartite tricarboxylate transporter family receptor
MLPIITKGELTFRSGRTLPARAQSSGSEISLHIRSLAGCTIGTLESSIRKRQASGWNGVGAPKNTPIEIIQKLNKEINAGLADPGMKARVAELGGMMLAGSPADFGKLIVDETEKWGKVIRAANIKPE